MLAVLIAGLPSAAVIATSGGGAGGTDVHATSGATQVGKLSANSDVGNADDGRPSGAQGDVEDETPTTSVSAIRSDAQTSVRIYSTDGTIQWAG